MNKKIIIHIGPGKTGTSAIQYWCNSNTDELLNQGIFYPKHGVDSNNIGSGNIEAIFEKVSSRLFELSKNKLDNVMMEFEQSGAHTLLLSSELFLTKLAIIKDAIPQAEFAVYIRNPLDIFQSIYNQNVKRKMEVKPFTIPPKFKNNLLIYLNRSIEAMGNSAFHIYPYDRGSFESGSIVTDFLSKVGYRGGHDGNKTINRSYCYEAPELKRFLNKFNIGNINKDLDLALQSYSGGTKKFRLLNKTKFERLKSTTLEELQRFSAANSIDSLTGLMEQIRSQQYDSVPFIRQGTLTSEFVSLFAYLNENYSVLVNKLQSIVKVSSALSYFEVQLCDLLGILKKDPEITFCCLQMKKIRSNINVEKSVDSEINFLLQLSSYFEDMGDKVSALHFMKAAHSKRPKGPYIQEKLKVLEAV
ncbi:hypothetical protein [Neptunicella marina]|uniref:Sulfotransferase domain-containing protein n=1 Tax=Neptunicella marina TaxID=2125989 RepID=A0A8J6M0L3_9ALTE|nr:hypothetical protein [Neptunicella marina]MBC3764948.1 hypothetical protein [Neptunicella marina]